MKRNKDQSNDVRTRSGSTHEVVVSAALDQIFTPRRLTDEESEGDFIAQETRELLERMRVELNRIKSSIDLRENMERTMSLKAARHFVSFKRPSATEGRQKESNTVTSQRLPHGGFFFVPMATAPMTHLTMFNYQEKQVQEKGQHSKPGQIEVGLFHDCPPWNSSTSLQSSEKTAAKNVTSTPVSVGNNPSISLKGLPQTVIPLGKDNDVGNKIPEWSSSRNEPETNSLDNTCTPVSRPEEMWIRDYLRRLNIVVREPAESEKPIDDPVLNGVALCRLVDVALKNKDQKKGSSMHSSLVLDPKNLDDVRRNYVGALNRLRGAEKDGILQIPRECRLIRPESVIVRGNSKTLFTLIRTIVDACLPTACHELWSVASITWQPYPDEGSYAPNAMRSLEMAVCNFLYSQNILADPVVHHMPPDDATVPNALGAPFLPPKRKQWSIRSEIFTSLYIPSVFPFLTNGTALCDLVERITSCRLSVHRNPRIKSNCMENIQTTFAALQEYCPAKMSPFFMDAPDRIFYGDRAYILFLLEDLMRMADGVSPRRHFPRAGDTPYLGPQRPFQMPPARGVQASRPLFPASVSEVKIRNHYQDPSEAAIKRTTKNMDDEDKIQNADKTSTANTTPRCVIASPLLEKRGGERSMLSRRISTSSAPVVEPYGKVCALDIPVARVCGVEYSDDEVELMEKWLIEVLGLDFHYTAADNSFSVSCRDLQLEKQPLLFSDGVVLAHLLRILERRRCVELESIEMHAKAAAAKRRNIKKCIAFLQSEKRIVLSIPLLDEILLFGDPLGVLYVVHCLKNTYRFAVRE